MRPVCVQITHYIWKKHTLFTSKNVLKGGTTIKTRADLYGQEAAELLRIITMYPGLSTDQLSRFFPKKEETVKSLLARLIRQGRIRCGETGCRYYPPSASSAGQRPLTDAVWVLLDFVEQAEYHSVSEFPVQLVFFSGGELYEVIAVAAGQEALITHILGQQKEASGRRLLLVDTPEQIPVLDIPGVCGYCTVKPDGQVTYYKKQ